MKRTLGLSVLAGAGAVAIAAAPAPSFGTAADGLAPANFGAVGAPGNVTPAKAKADGKLRGELGEVVRNAAPDELIPISIVLADQVSKEEINLASQHPDKADRREDVTLLLKARAAETQGELLALLEEARADGKVDGRIRALWLHNVIATSATPDVIDQLAPRDDVGWINFDKQLGEEVFPVQPQPVNQQQPGGPLNGNIECGVDLMNAPGVWTDFGITGEGVTVGIIDTGVCDTHPDLVNQLWNNEDEVPGNGVDDDGNGYIDDVNGYNFRDDHGNTNDDWGHGTHVGGTVVGDGTNGTVTGMAPNAQLMDLKFWNNFGGESIVWEAMQYAVDNDADVITASIGWPHSVDPDRVTWRMSCENAMAAGVVVVYAAGNEGNCCGPVDNVRTPGDVPDMITVGATDCNTDIAGFSSRGPVTWEGIDPYDDWPYPPGKIKPTISAPGVNTVSTSNNCSGYTTLSGTSMATPHVSGAVALILEADPNLDHFDVKQVLKDNAIDLGQADEDNTYGWGFVDVYEAVVAVMGPTDTAQLTDFEILEGNLINGGLGDLTESDDNKLRVSSVPGFTAFEPNVTDVLVGASIGIEASSLTLSLEGNINQPGGTAKAILNNWDAGSQDQVGQFDIDFGDETVEVDVNSAGPYVRDDGRIEVRWRNVVIAPLTAVGFDSRFDHVEIFGAE